MTDYYDVTGSPGQAASLSSSVIRAEFTAIATGISAKLPPLTGNGREYVRVNAGATGLESAPGVDLATGNVFAIGGATVLNATTLGTAVVASSLTSVGTLTSLTVSGTVTGPSGTWDSGGMDIATTDTYAIAGTDVLTATTLGSAVVNSSLTNLGTLTALTVDDITVNASDISTAVNNLTLTPVAGKAVVIDGGASFDGTVLTGLTALTSTAITGTLQTGAQTNVTSVGTLTALSVSGNITFDGDCGGNLATSGAIFDEAASGINPTLIPDRSQPTLGVGSSGAGVLSLTADAVESLLIRDNTQTTSDQFEMASADSLISASIITFKSSSSSTSGRELVAIRNLNTAAVDARCLLLTQSAAGTYINFAGAEGANTSDPISTHTTLGAVAKNIRMQINGTNYWIAARLAPSA